MISKLPQQKRKVAKYMEYPPTDILKRKDRDAWGELSTHGSPYFSTVLMMSMVFNVLPTAEVIRGRAILAKGKLAY